MRQEVPYYLVPCDAYRFWSRDVSRQKAVVCDHADAAEDGLGKNRLESEERRMECDAVFGGTGVDVGHEIGEASSELRGRVLVEGWPLHLRHLRHRRRQYRR